MNNNRIPSSSPDLTQRNIEKLKELFPEIITEGKIDFDMLKTVLGKEVDDRNERYRFEWHGKRESLIGAQQPSKGTLRPDKEASKNFDTTENLYIEGDNLEVLKLLQKSYNGKVKLIYIDPPYNTGHDFVYEDDFTDNIQNYLELTGQTNEEKIKISTNTETSGRKHTNWLNMMYSRLKLARNLLTDDGVIFVSIDDNEVLNLGNILNEIYGEQNKVAIVANIANPKGRSDSKFIATGHEYILIYAKNISDLKFGGFELEEKITKRYNKIDDDGRKYRETDLKKGGFGDKREDRPAMFYYFIFDEKTGEFYPSRTKVEGKISIKPIRADGTDGRWRWGFENSEKNLDKLLVRWMPAKNQWGVFEKDYLDKRDSVKAPSYWSFKDVNNERGVEVFTNYGFSRETFENPKPVGTMKRVLQLGTPLNEDDIILDFFSGSSTTAEAIMQQNAEDGGNRKFIMVQLPEELDEKSEAYKAGFHNICEIGQERIRRAGEKIIKEYPEAADRLDVGFKVLKLDKSNIREWNVDFEKLEEQITSYDNMFVPGRSELDVVYEIMLKYGLELTYPVNTFQVNGKNIYDIALGNLFICLDDNIDTTIAQAIIDKRNDYGIETSSVVFADHGFHGNDSEKLNCFKLLEDAGYQNEQLMTI